MNTTSNVVKKSEKVINDSVKKYTSIQNKLLDRIAEKVKEDMKNEEK